MTLSGLIDVDDTNRVEAVWSHYSGRSSRVQVRDRAYMFYVVALMVLMYLAPVMYFASAAPQLVSVGEESDAAIFASVVGVVAFWVGQIAGRFRGPLLMRPSLLHVFISTDVSPERYLGPIAYRRMAYVGAIACFSACTAMFIATDVFDRAVTAVQGFAVVLGLSGGMVVAWLWGEVRSASDNLRLAAIVPVGAVVAGAIGSITIANSADGLWVVAGVAVAGTLTLGWLAFGSVPRVDLGRLARDSARASLAQVFIATGTLHHALTLYRPEPKGFGSALILSDGRLRGYLTQGLVRVLRTPSRAIAAGVSLVIGGGVLTLGLVDAAGIPSWFLLVTGSTLVYLGSGWIGDTWGGLLDELTLAPLFGNSWGGTLARTLVWPVASVVAGSSLGSMLTLMFHVSLAASQLSGVISLLAGTLVLVLSARFLSAMKRDLPAAMLVPIVTPLGDLSGLRILAWQFDGLVALLAGVLLMAGAPSTARATLLGFSVACCCVGVGLQRTGFDFHGRLFHLGRLSIPSAARVSGS